MQPPGGQNRSPSKVVMASVYLRARTGRSLLQEGKPPPRELQPFLATPETVQKAVSELRQRGFNIEAQGVTLSISGPPELFERLCGVKITVEEITIRDSKSTHPWIQLVCRSSRRVMNIKGLEDLIEGIVLMTPGVPFKGHKSEI